MALASLARARRPADRPWSGARPVAPQWAVGGTPSAGEGEAVLATWRLLLDEGRLQDGEPYLAGTRHPSVARLSAATAAAVGIGDGELARGVHRPRHGDAAAGGHRDAGPRRLGAHELPGQRGPPYARGRRRRGGPRLSAGSAGAAAGGQGGAA